MSRQYANFKEALNEMRRDLKEMGIRVHSKSYQNKNISDNPDFDSLEIQNYQYTVTAPDYRSIPVENLPWCELEFAERVSRKNLNPGEAWKLRDSTWRPFLKKDGKFDYTYPERLSMCLDDVIGALKQDLSTRRAFLPVFDRQEDMQSNFSERIPCSLGYWLNYRQGRLNITYLQRSADFSEHFKNDLWLSERLKVYIAGEVGVKEGFFTHWIGSLHCFAKDMAGVF